MFSHMFLLFQLLLSFSRFSQNHYLLISLPFLGCTGIRFLVPFFCTFGTPSQYIVHAPPCFWHRTRGFLEARCLWEPGSSLTTGEFSPFLLFAEGFLCKGPLDSTRIIPFLLTKILELTLSCVTKASKNYAVQLGYRIPKGFPNL